MDWRKNSPSFRNRAGGETSCDWKSGFRQHSRVPNRCGKWQIETVRSFRGLSFAGMYEVSASGIGRLTSGWNTRNTMSKTSSRRTFLYGAGVTMALPWLESLPVWAAETGAAGSFPKRFAVMFMGNGINGNHWWAKGSGEDLKLSKTLEPLEPLKKKINVINGLFNKPAVGVGIHPAQTGNLLSGMPLQKGAIVKSGISVDQVLAKHVGQDTPQSSLVLACEQPMTGYHETNFSMAYSSHISWYSADSPVPNEVYPSLAFDRLFENGGSLRNRSVLDRVKDCAESLRRQVSLSDQTNLD